MAAEGSYVNSAPSQASTQEKRLKKRKRNLPITVKDRRAADNKVKVVYTATVPMKRLKLLSRSPNDAEIIVIKARKSTSDVETKSPSSDTKDRSHKNEEDCDEKLHKMIENNNASTDRNERVDQFMRRGISAPENQTPFTSSDSIKTECQRPSMGKTDVVGSRLNLVKSESDKKKAINPPSDMKADSSQTWQASSCLSEADTCGTKRANMYEHSANINDSKGFIYSLNSRTQSRTELHEPQETTCINRHPQEHAYNDVTDEVRSTGNYVIPCLNNADGSGPNQIMDAEETSVTIGNIPSRDKYVGNTENILNRMNASDEGSSSSIKGDGAASKMIVACHPDLVPSPERVTSTSEENSNGNRTADHREININTITTGELTKFLNQYNLTLKAVPIDDSLIRCNSVGAVKLSPVCAEKRTELRLIPPKPGANGKKRIRAAIPIDCQGLTDLKIRSDQGENTAGRSDSSVLLQLRLHQGSEHAVIKTPNGTFCNWRMNGGKASKACRSQARLLANNKTSHAAIKNGKWCVSPSHQFAENATKLYSKHCAKSTNGTQDRGFNENNAAKLQYASCVQPVIPLSRAFHDLEARDQAARETVQSLESSANGRQEMSLKTSTSSSMCPLSPNLRNLVNKGIATENSDLEVDPVLTSAVALESTETRYQNVSNDLMLSSFLLHAPRDQDSTDGVASHSESLNEHCYQPCLKIAENECVENQSSRRKNVATGQQLEDNCDEFRSAEYYPFSENVSESVLDRMASGISSKSAKDDFSDHGDGTHEISSPLDGNTVTVDKQFCPGFHFQSNNDFPSNNDKEKSPLSSNAIGSTRCELSSTTNASTKDSPILEHNRCRSRKRASSSSSHCSRTECVISTVDETRKPRFRAERPQQETQRPQQEKGATKNLKIEPLENWTCVQVKSWLEKTTLQFSSNNETAAKKLDGKTLQRRNKERKTTDSVRIGSMNGHSLCSFTLENFFDCCSDKELANYLFEKVQQLRSKAAGSQLGAVDRDMYNDSQCAMTSPPSVALNSAEQLEDAVNFDDLLGSESILGSLELTDVLDSHCSFLKSLGQESDVHQLTESVYAPPYMNMQIMEHNNFSPIQASAVAALNAEEDFHSEEHPILQLRSPPPTCPPPLLHLSAHFHQQDVKLSDQCRFRKSSFSSVEQYGEQEVIKKMKRETQDQYHFPQLSYSTCGAVSPSTYYNLPKPDLQSSCMQVSDKQLYHLARVNTSPESETVSRFVRLNVPNSRETAMSDTDSGIHSPDSTPNKNQCGARASMSLTNTMLMPDIKLEDTFTHYRHHSPNCNNAEDAYFSRDGLWLDGAESEVSTPFNTSESPAAMEVFAFPSEKAIVDNRRNSITEAADEKWESGSSSSTASTVSAESETKLLNMDDCKTYIAGSPMHGRTSFQCPLSSNINVGTPIVRTPSGDVVFVPSVTSSNFGVSEVQTTTNDASRVSMQSTNKRPQLITQGNITTVYPAFVSNVRLNRAVSCTENKLLSGPANVTEHTRSFDDTTPDASIMRTSSSYLTEDKTITTPGFRHQRGDKFPISKSIAQGYVGRRHVSEGQDTGLEDPFDPKMRRTSGKSVHLWEFIRDTLLNPSYCPRLIKWEDRTSGVFRFVQSDVVAGMWGEKKNNPKMTYEKLSRAMRYYYNRGILERVDGRRLVYKFGKNAHGWQQVNPTENTQKPAIPQHESEAKTEKRIVVPKKEIESPKRSPSCRISVAMSNDFLPSPNKRRRQSINGVDSSKSGDQKSAGTQTPPGLTSKASQAVEEEANVVADSNSAASGNEDITECVVFVARSTSSELSLSPERQSKLPSADVLLGKHYKIATVAI